MWCLNALVVTQQAPLEWWREKTEDLDMSYEENVFSPKVPGPPLTTSFSVLEIFRCHSVTTAFFQNSPPGIDLSKDILAPLK